MWDTPKDQKIVEGTMEALVKNGINAKYFTSRETIKAEVFSLIPKGAEVMNMTSVTLDTLGISQTILESGEYNSIRKKLMQMDSAKERIAKLKLGAAPEYAIGSVHAVTEEGQVMIASNGGSQMPGYVYGSANVIWVVGTQKIVKNIDEGFKRIYTYCLPKEDERAQRILGFHSNVSKILIINKEVVASRINLLFLNENIGF